MARKLNQAHDRKTPRKSDRSIMSLQTLLELVILLPLSGKQFCVSTLLSFARCPSLLFVGNERVREVDG